MRPGDGDGSSIEPVSYLLREQVRGIKQADPEIGQDVPVPGALTERRSKPMRIDWLFWIELALFGVAILLFQADATGPAVVFGVTGIALEFVRRILGIASSVRDVKASKK
jgi:hypothetical protein